MTTLIRKRFLLLSLCNLFFIFSSNGQFIESEIKDDDLLEVQKSMNIEENNQGKIDRSVFYKNVVFHVNRGEVPKASEDALNQIANELLKHPETRIKIKGHTCDQGSQETNRHYSKKRAEVIRDYLLSKGVLTEQMTLEAMLDSEPLVPNDNEENRKINRRVEILLIN